MLIENEISTLWLPTRFLVFKGAIPLTPCNIQQYGWSRYNLQYRCFIIMVCTLPQMAKKSKILNYLPCGYEVSVRDKTNMVMTANK